MLARGVNFYRPDGMPTQGKDRELDELIGIRRFHEEYYSHPNVNEMKWMG